MDVVERQPRVRERLLPVRPLVGALLVRLDPLHGLGQVRLGAAELHTAGAALVSRQPFLQCLLHRALQWRDDGRAHRVGMGRDRVDPADRFGLACNLVDEMEADVAARPLIGHHGRQRRQSPAGLFALRLRAERTVLAHAAEHVGEPFLRPRRLPIRAEIVRPLGQAGEQRALLQRELLRRLAEIAARRQLDPPGAAPEIDRVEIKLEDLVLAEPALDPRGNDHLADLALVGQVFAHQQVLHDLLGDGRAALRAPGLREVADEGADQAALVDALVLVEALVLGGDEGIAHLLRDIGERNPHPALVLLEHLGETLALAVEHHAGTGQLEALELAVVRQVGDRLVVEIDHAAEIDGRLLDLLVLAELPVGGLQIGKTDAAERLALADRLRVVQRGRDQVVEVDALDVEGFDHMGAAGAQQLRHLRLILVAVELGLHRVRRRRHLAERQCRREDFDEERFHPGPDPTAVEQNICRIPVPFIKPKGLSGDCHSSSWPPLVTPLRVLPSQPPDQGSHKCITRTQTLHARTY